MRILVADEDRVALNMVADFLTEAGHEVIPARSGTEVLEKALDLRPDLVIVDAVLPDLLGSEVSVKLKDFRCTASVPVLLISEGVEELEAVTGNAGEFLADDFLHKPLTRNVLLDRVNRLVKLQDRSVPREGGGGQDVRPSGAERRKSPRVPIDVQVTAKTAEVLLFHPMINISSGGVYIELDRWLEDGTELELHFEIPGKVGRVTATGEVAWCLELQDGIHWGTGVCFTALRAEDLEKVKRYTTSLLKVVRPVGASDD